jgi:hypothetical protein
MVTVLGTSGRILDIHRSVAVAIRYDPPAVMGLHLIAPVERQRHAELPGQCRGGLMNLLAEQLGPLGMRSVEAIRSEHSYLLDQGADSLTGDDR